MAKELNATCRVCGSAYHRCDSCNEKNGVLSYKRFTDCPNCFKIYATITSNDSIDEKKKILKTCDLSEINNFNIEAKKEIELIMEEKTIKKKSINNNEDVLKS